MKTLRTLAVTLMAVLAASGCSNLKKAFGVGDSVAQEDNYRVTQDAMLSPLELPPGFQNPNRNMDASNRVLMGQLNDKIARQDVPSFRVDGLSVQANMSERWLHVDKADAGDLWERMQRFLTSQGFAIEEARRDIGVIRTAYLPRKEIVPKSEMGFLSRILNAWRDETAKGALDRLTVRLASDGKGGMDIFLRHSMLIENADGDMTYWRSRPYHPVFESEMLYQALVFLGTSKAQAQSQVAVTEKRLEMSVNGEFQGVTLAAGMEESWQHLLALADRAGFAVVSTDKATHRMTLRLPAASQSERGFFARLFSSSSNDLPEQVVLKFTTKDKVTEIVPSTLDERALSGEQKKRIFQQLGVTE